MTTPFHAHQAHAGAVGSYLVQLLVPQPVEIDHAELLALLRLQDPTAELVEAEGSRKAFVFRQADLPINAQGKAPMAFVTAEPAITNTDDIEAAAAQTWDWPHAGEVAGRCQALVSVSDLHAEHLPRETRLALLHAVVRAVMAQVPVAVLHWLPAQRLIHPHAYVHSLDEGGTVIDHAVNVRLFNVGDGGPGERLMDTLGLHAFGLPDLQIHFTGLDPNQIARLLAKYAEYLWAKGDVLQDDHLVRGVQAWEEWPVKRQESLLDPPRLVVDIRPEKNGVAH